MTKQISLILLATVVFVSLTATPFWSNFRHSGNLANDTFPYRVQIRCDFNNPDSPLHKVEYRTETGITVDTMQLIQDGYAAPPSYKFNLGLPAGNPLSLGFRQVRSDGTLEIAPVKYAGTQPALTEMSQCATDPAGDALFNMPALDLLGYSVTFSSDKLFFALVNNSTSFPVSSGFTFYSYMATIVNPNNPSPTQTAYGLLYTINQAGIISPGLYKITGTAISDMVRLGNITATTSAGSNTLFLSCNWADLLADADFAAWYNTAGSIACMGLTQKITLTSGALEADRTAGVNVYPVNEQYTWVDNHIPVLTDYNAYCALPETSEDPVMFIDITYSDADADFPVHAELSFDSGQTYPLAPVTYDFNSEVIYRNTDTYGSFFYGNTWQTMTFRFWYTETDFVEYIVNHTANNESLAPEPALSCTVYPNPFSQSTTIAFAVSKTTSVGLSVYNVKGQCVKILLSGTQPKGKYSTVWNGTDNAGKATPSGIYLIKLEGMGKTQITRVIRLK